MILALALLLTVDPGGVVTDYFAASRFYAGPLPQSCYSACTMYLHRGCVVPLTTLYFHGATVPIATAMMLDSYPAPIRAWALRRHALDRPEFTPMSGAEAIRLGARRCPN